MIEITNIAHIGEALKISFSPGGAGYILTHSGNLADTFVELPSAGYDKVNTFTIPVGALNLEKGFFRVEKTP